MYSWVETSGNRRGRLHERDEQAHRPAAEAIAPRAHGAHSVLAAATARGLRGGRAGRLAAAGGRSELAAAAGGDGTATALLEPLEFDLRHPITVREPAGQDALEFTQDGG
jgi:hypothetical protein